MNTRTTRVRPWALLAVLLVADPSCSGKLQESYTVEIVGPVTENYFLGVQEVALELNGKELDRQAINPARSFTLEAKGVDVSASPAATFRIRGFDANGNLVAYGQSPEVELERSSWALRVFVQKPGTFGRSIDLTYPRKGHFAVSASAKPTASGSLPVTVAFFGMGHFIGPNAQGMAVDALSDVFHILDPISHVVTTGNTSATIQGVPQPRADAAAIVRPDGNILIFGGLLKDATSGEEKPSGQLDYVRVRRPEFDFFERENAGAARLATDPAIARSRTALAASNLVFAFGGRGTQGALDTVVSIDVDASDMGMTIVPERMASPRLGHTATAVGDLFPDVLVFGGGDPGKPVAELFRPNQQPRFEVPQGSPGPMRREHAAIALPDGRVLIVGGAGDDGAPRADSVLYNPSSRSFATGPITLKKARKNVAAFVLVNDIVIAGGTDETGTPIGDAEIYNLSDFTFRAATPFEARARAEVAVLGNQSAVILGGEGRNGAPAAAVEIYQPNRTAP